MGNLTFLFAAYTIIWAAALIYSFSIASRQKSLEREIRMLQQLLEERGGESANS